MGNGCHALTRMLPAWVRERGGRLELIPTRAATVKHIYALAAGGYGHAAIFKALRDDNVEPFGQKVLALHEEDVVREDGKVIDRHGNVRRKSFRAPCRGQTPINGNRCR